MFERRPVWGIFIGLTVTISIWRISVQEPSMLAQYGYNGNVGTTVGNTAPQAAAAFYQQQPLHGGKHLLARKTSNLSAKGWQDRHTKAPLEAKSINKTHARAQTDYEYKTTASRRSKNLNVVMSSLSQHTQGLSGESETSSSKVARNRSKTVESQSGTISGKRRVAVDGETSPLLSSQQSSHFLRFVSNPKQASVNASITTSAPTPSQAPAVTPENRPVIISATSGDAVHSHLPASDFERLVDLHNFHYIMQQPACAPEIEALILVHSAPANYRKRLLLRETWAQRSLLQGTPVRLIFMLGAVANQTLQHKLRQENQIFADMVQGNFMDDYKNMTYKHVMAFKWFIYNCARAQILLKVDDDVFVNTPQLLQYINESRETAKYSEVDSEFTAEHNRSSKGNVFIPSQSLFRRPQNLLFCQEVLQSRVKRSFRSKWRVSVREYANRYYPPYCPGYSIVYSPDVLLRLYATAQRSKYFWIDDVHVTGTLAQMNNITITTSLPYVLSSDTCERVIAGKTDVSELEFLFAWSGIKEQQIRALWELNLLHYKNLAAKFDGISQVSKDSSDAAAVQYIYDGSR